MLPRLSGCLHLQARLAPSRSAVALLGRALSSAAQAAPISEGDRAAELDSFREHVREFAKGTIALHAEHIDRSNSFPATVDLWREMGSFGLLGEERCPQSELEVPSICLRPRKRRRRSSQGASLRASGAWCF